MPHNQEGVCTSGVRGRVFALQGFSESYFFLIAGSSGASEQVHGYTRLCRVFSHTFGELASLCLCSFADFAIQNMMVFRVHKFCFSNSSVY